jgi:hypothetical protein
MKGYCKAMYELCHSENPNRLKFCQAYEENCITDAPIDLSILLITSLLMMVLLNFYVNKSILN